MQNVLKDKEQGDDVMTLGDKLFSYISFYEANVSYFIHVRIPTKCMITTKTTPKT